MVRNTRQKRRHSCQGYYFKKSNQEYFWIKKGVREENF
jgi:hypothetical protein